MTLIRLRKAIQRAKINDTNNYNEKLGKIREYLNRNISEIELIIRETKDTPGTDISIFLRDLESYKSMVEIFSKDNIATELEGIIQSPFTSQDKDFLKLIKVLTKYIEMK